MGFFEWLFGSEDADPVPAPAESDDSASTDSGPGDSFDFSESVGAEVNPLPSFVRDAPPAGAATLIVMDEQAQEIAKDRVRVSEPAPTGAVHIAGQPATYHRVGGTGNAHQEVLVDMDDRLPIEIPDHIAEKADLGGEKLRLLWSCETDE